jgi:glycosyltransferase involved in cell wall biosynthesis
MARKLGGDVLFVPYWAGPWWQPVPTVVTIHDLIPILLPEYRGGWLQRAYFRLVSVTARRASHVITVSEASKRDVVTHLGIGPERITPVHHGPNLVPSQPVEPSALAQVRERYHLPDRYFLYLGGFDVRKNVAGILAGYAAYLAKGGDPGVKLVLAGKLPAADTPFTPDPRRLAQEAGVEPSQLHLPGWVDEADKPGLYAGAVAFLFPSRYEGFGMMTLEAQAAGTPVISGG